MAHHEGIPGLEEVRFARDEDLGGLEVRLARYKDFAFANHWHDCYSIGAALSGGSLCIRNRENSVIQTGQLCLLNPGQVHSGIPARDVGITYLMFYVDPEEMRRVVTRVTGRDEGYPEFRNVISADPALFQAMMRLDRAVFGKGGLLTRESLSLAALAGLLVRAGHLRPASRCDDGEPGAVARAREYLAANLAGPVRLDDLARAAGLSAYHLLRVFKKAVGVTPHAWLTQLRVERARHLLLRGVSPAEAALSTGFYDQSHFTNTFRRFMGVTPRRYRLLR
ncbi:helix-turn-helix domain-containing protein [Desulfovibrio aminophilus]|uniref:AraC family transcriptional regulator n=1 Tax=Desulfovibrio aminophilus TaxID=81425 RepID=UPI003392EBAD